MTVCPANANDRIYGPVGVHCWHATMQQWTTGLSPERTQTENCCWCNEIRVTKNVLLPVPGHGKYGPMEWRFL